MKRKLIFIVLACCYSLGLFLLPVAATQEKAGAGNEAADFPQQVRIPVRLLAGRPKVRETEFLISPEALKKMEGAGNLLLIDVRTAKEYETLKMPGSVNLPLYALKTKRYLREKKLVLINEGYAYSDLLEECRRLKQLDFKDVSVLDGGLNAWQESGYPLEGDVFAIGKLNKVSPQNFFKERDYQHWLIVSLLDADKEDMKLLPFQVVYLPRPSGEIESAKFPALLKERVAKWEKMGRRYILLCDEDGRFYEQVERLLKREIKNVYYLEGGLTAYKKFLQEQVLIGQAKNKPAKTGKCKNCP